MTDTDAPPDSPAPAARPLVVRAICALTSFALLAALGVATVVRVNPPEPTLDRVDPEYFSMANTLEHLKRIASEPRPSGSDAHARVREYLSATFAAAGLKVKTEESQTSEYPILNQLARGRVVNVVARYSGWDTNSNAAVLIMAHYDSVAQAPGAGDDGAAVAAVLETARAIGFQPQLRNDIIFLITDAEELCLCGAQAFAEADPWAKDVAVVVNFEARGTSGPSIMFETTPGNRSLIREFSRAATHPVTSSLSYEVYRMMPNNTDLTVMRKAGYPGINFAFIGDAQNYHTPNDNLENLSLASAWHHGRNMLALTRWLGNRDLSGFIAEKRPPEQDLGDFSKNKVTNPAGAVEVGNAVYFDLWAWRVIRYPDSLNWPLAALSLAAHLAVTAGALRKRRIKWGALAAGAALALVSLAWAGYFINEMRTAKASRSFPPGAFDPGVLAFRCSLLLVALAVVFTVVSRWWSGAGMALGAWFVWLVLLFACVALVPGAAYLFTWPALAALAGMAVAQRMESRSPAAAHPAIRAGVATLAAVPAVALFAPVVYLVFLAMSVKMFFAVALLVFIGATFALPAFDLTRRD